MRVREIAANGLTFRAREHGYGTPVLLLHGFPETSAMWAPLMERLAGEGFHCLAPDQRGYSPGARPADVGQYDYDHLASDTAAFLDAMGWDRAHLIGHDWGAGAGWCAIDATPERFLSWTPMSVPHLAAFGKTIQESEQQRQMSGYVDLFRQEGTAESVLSANEYQTMRDIFATTHPPEEVQEYVDVMSTGALTGGLNWYRANEGFRTDRAGREFVPVATPTLLIWGKNDPYIGRDAIMAGHAYMTGPYQLLELDCGHWIVQEALDLIAGPITAHLKQHS